MTPPSASMTSSSLALAKLDKARIVYIGEKHDQPSHHHFQEQIIRMLRQQGKSLAVAMEMLDVTQQPALEDYLQGQLSWISFARRTGFDCGWGKTSPGYKRILSWCRRNMIPVLALNAPEIVARKLARNQPLTAEEKQLIPIYPAPPAGFEQFQKAIGSYHPIGHSARRYYQAQRARDQTMAGRILMWLSQQHGTLVVMLGRFHADPYTGVPWYVGRKANVRQLILFPTDRSESLPPVRSRIATPPFDSTREKIRSNDVQHAKEGPISAASSIPRDEGKLAGICLERPCFRSTRTIDIHNQRVPLSRGATGCAGGTARDDRAAGVDSYIFADASYLHYTPVWDDVGIDRAMSLS